MAGVGTAAQLARGPCSEGGSGGGGSGGQGPSLLLEQRAVLGNAGFLWVQDIVGGTEVSWGYTLGESGGSESQAMGIVEAMR